MDKLEALNQAIKIVKKYIENSKEDPSDEVIEVIDEIEKRFTIPQSKLDKITDILLTCKLKNKKNSIKMDEADKYILKGLILKSMRMSKKLKEAADFENDSYDFNELLKMLENKKRKEEKDLATNISNS
jgi:GTP-binding protein EngB required for normal cell division